VPGSAYVESGRTLDLDSPNIDAGDPEADYSNEAAPNFGRVNMRAYGNTTEA